MARLMSRWARDVGRLEREVCRVMGRGRGGTNTAWLNDSSEHRAGNPDTDGELDRRSRQMWQGDVMATWVVLLRGINVGGANRLAMADLRDVMATLGHSEVVTYIQSGNVVVTNERVDRATLAAEISAEIGRRHGLTVSAVLRTPEELRASLAANPFTSEIDATRVSITFLSDAPSAENVARLERDRFLPDQFVVVGGELYGHYPNGAGRSKMTLDYFEKRLGVRGTARNLNTVSKLIDLSTR
jgi:uncharacterized protein (DUF1697 family)